MERAPLRYTYTDLISSAEREFGVVLKILNTGGGCEVLHGRLESGHWLVVSDADDFLAEEAYQLERDADGDPLGWFAGIYENDASEGVDWPTSHVEGGCVAWVLDRNARFSELNSVIRAAHNEFGHGSQWHTAHAFEQRHGTDGPSAETVRPTVDRPLAP